ncbi:GUN4 domain-containing protein [Nostoc favosum]|uniref:GUN4 domain-containing protein n=1 Tax=Nostoc favosum CHAB5714 TaxID=2780399 RepID=A0ABS8IFC5_9NOSO|nr:GUN4 domain-containing protein [Nostoc favosum]MCC5602474.1 GUN4 domain-containing protein [Nostoc favosum CHAB5714]
MTYEYHVFISHSSKDKEGFVGPLAEELRKKNYNVWYDEFSLKLGDKLPKEIDEALSKSRYGIVVLSPNFFGKKIDKEIDKEIEWTYYELNSLMCREQDGTKVILPIWHGGVNEKNVEQYFTKNPDFAKKLVEMLGVYSSLGIDKVVSKIIEILELDDLSSACGVNYNRLSKLLADGNWKEADRETYLRMLQIMEIKEGQGLWDTKVKVFPCTDLRTIDQLWVKHSNGRFGFSVQKEIYLNVGGNLNNYEFTLETTKVLIKFADCVGWVKGEEWDINWIEYGEGKFNIQEASLGHFPLRIYFTRAVLFSKEMQEGLPEETRNNIVWADATFVPHFARRLVDCNIYPIGEIRGEIKSPRTDYLEYHYLMAALGHKEWKAADSITYSMMLEVLGLNEDDKISSNGLSKFPQVVLDRIDNYWRELSDNRFGFSVQKKIYLEVGGKVDGKYDERAFTRFAERVGWTKRKDLIVKDWNDLIFNTDAPEGHLPALVWWGLLPGRKMRILFSRIREYPPD